MVIYDSIIKFIRDWYGTEKIIPLHTPIFRGNEKKYLEDCIDSTYVSSVGKYVDRFEKMICNYTGAKMAVVTVNGTAALHVALKLCGVVAETEVITQPLTFIATANSIVYTGAKPIFIDVDKETLGLSPDKLNEFLTEKAEMYDDGFCYNKKTKRRISSCVPMHTFGHPNRIEEIVEICNKHNIDVIEDAAESIGSKYNGKHTGLFGHAGILSFNGNKTITTGGGGMIITNDKKLGENAKHITTTARLPHRWEYVHDYIGYNYRMPNINAALGCAQLEELPVILKEKRELAKIYKDFFKSISIKFVWEPVKSHSNFWLNSIILKDKNERDTFLKYMNDNGIMTRPIWRLMNKLEIYAQCQRGNLENAEWLVNRVVNLPSSVRIG